MESSELLDRLTEQKVATLTCSASGSGDEGCVDEVCCWDSEGRQVPTTDDIESEIEQLFDNVSFDYYNGNGGELELTIDVGARSISWEGRQPVMEVSWQTSEVVE